MLITGAAGFIGRHLCVHLRDAGWHVTALVRRPWAGLPGGVEPIIGDVETCDLATVIRARPRIIVHLAARTHAADDARSTRTEVEHAYHRVNVQGTARMIEAAQRAGARRFIYISSVKAAVASERPEEWNPYGRTKLEAEALVNAADASGLETAILRLPITYGPGMKGNMPRLFRCVASGVPLPLGAVHNSRSMVYVDNAVAAIAALMATHARGEFAVTDEEDVSVRELVLRIGRALGRPPRLVSVPVSLLRAAGAVADALNRVTPFPIASADVARLTESLTMDATRLRRETGYARACTLDEGLRRTAAWFRAGGG